MSAGALIVIALRVLIPLSIPKWPIAGGIASMLIDALDVVLITLMHLGGFDGHYHSLDKLLDSYYLAIEWGVALRWENAWARGIAAALFPYRLIGVALFEATDDRIMLFIFPNLFENWWLYCAVTLSRFPRFAPRSLASSAVILLALLIPKMGQEYLLHYAEAQPWDWTKRHIFRGAI